MLVNGEVIPPSTGDPQGMSDPSRTADSVAVAIEALEPELPSGTGLSPLLGSWGVWRLCIVLDGFGDCGLVVGSFLDSLVASLSDIPVL